MFIFVLCFCEDIKRYWVITIKPLSFLAEPEGLLNFKIMNHFTYCGIEFKIPIYPEGNKYMIDNLCTILANKAVHNGILTKQPCEICGTIKNIVKHHEDYNQPLNIRWLCKRHHYDIHSIICKIRKNKYQLTLY